jgi:hypothetical protein
MRGNYNHMNEDILQVMVSKERGESKYPLFLLFSVAFIILNICW